MGPFRVRGPETPEGVEAGRSPQHFSIATRTGATSLAEHQVDAVVIGAGPGGYHAAIRLGQLGKNVICVDRDEVGGVCLNWGCIPTKALLHVGEVVRHIEHAAAIGLKVPKPEVDREGVAKFKTDVVNANVGGVKTLFKANGVEFFVGEASFKSPTEIVMKRTAASDSVKAETS